MVAISCDLRLDVKFWHKALIGNAHGKFSECLIIFRCRSWAKQMGHKGSPIILVYINPSCLLGDYIDKWSVCPYFSWIKNLGKSFDACIFGQSCANIYMRTWSDCSFFLPSISLLTLIYMICTDPLCPEPRPLLLMHLGKRDQNAKYFKRKEDVCKGELRDFQGSKRIKAPWLKYVILMFQCDVLIWSLLPRPSYVM